MACRVPVRTMTPANMNQFEEIPQVKWPRFEAAEPIEDGQKLAILVREFDGSISAVRIAIEQVAD